MSSDVSLWFVEPGTSPGPRQPIGYISIRDIAFTGSEVDSQKALDIEVEAHPGDQPITINRYDKKLSAMISWLSLNAEIRTTQPPRRTIGRVHIDGKGMLPIGPSRRGRARWSWLLFPEDIETVERTRTARPGGPLYFQVTVTGIARLIDPDAQLRGIEQVQGNLLQLSMEHSQWERHLAALDYHLPPSQAALADPASTADASWATAMKSLDPARTHHRAGEDYDALRDCLSLNPPRK